MMPHDQSNATTALCVHYRAPVHVAHVIDLADFFRLYHVSCDSAALFLKCYKNEDCLTIADVTTLQQQR